MISKIQIQFFHFQDFHHYAEAPSDLMLADSSITISEIANRWGFRHMGRFAPDFRILFGELPTQTLNMPESKVIEPAC